MTDGKFSSLAICAGADMDTQTWRDVECPPVPTNYQRFAAAVRSGVNGDPDFRRGAALQQILDLSFAANGLGTLAGRVSLGSASGCGNTRCRKTTLRPKPARPRGLVGSRLPILRILGKHDADARSTRDRA